jgi:cytosine/adenosine deaminase-related metal-dependent hydrolase
MGADSDSADYGQPTHQALAAREILELYMWWREVRPARPDPYKASGWTAYCERRRNGGRDFFDLEDKTEEEAEQGRVASEQVSKIEAEYEQEDTDMLIRLIRVRDGLWT